MSHPSWVCGLKHALRYIRRGNGPSHPSWVCGLKHTLVGEESAATIVTPFVGVWIETSLYCVKIRATVCHTLRGCVD